MPRRYRVVALAVWPGLAQIWQGQEVLGVLLGFLFASTVNLAVVSRWIWTEAFSPGWCSFFATSAVGAWLAGFGYTVWWVILCHPERYRAEIEKLFREAHEAYLLGRWADAKQRIERILACDETDADALLQLGSIYLRTQQPALARRAFVQCLELQRGAKWRWEINRALSRLDCEQVGTKPSR
jgi:tetratricopeptide (TPR) repeat protein